MEYPLSLFLILLGLIVLLIPCVIVALAVWFAHRQTALQSELSLLRDQIGTVHQRHAELVETVVRQGQILGAMQGSAVSLEILAAEAEAVTIPGTDARKAEPVVQSLEVGETFPDGVVADAGTTEAMPGAGKGEIPPSRPKVPTKVVAPPQRAVKGKAVAPVTAPAEPSLAERIGGTMQESPLVL